MAKISGGYEVLRGGQGFSTQTLQKGDVVTKRIWGGGGSSKKITPKPEPKVTISGNTVMIDGVGYTVRQQDQASFIQKQTGGYGQSSQIAIAKAEEEAKRIAAQKAAIAAQKYRELVASKKIGGQVMTAGKSTITGMGLTPDKTYPSILPGQVIEKRIIGYDKDPDTGRKIPTTEYVYVDPTNIGWQKERPATEEEMKYFKEQTNLYGTTTTTKPGFYRTSGLKDALGGLKLEVKKTSLEILEGTKKAEGQVSGGIAATTTKGIEKVESYTGWNLASTIPEAKLFARSTTKSLIKLGVPKQFAQSGEFVTGIGLGSFEYIRDNPLKVGAIVGTAAVGGAVFGGVRSGAVASAGGLFGAKAAVATGIGLDVGLVGAGIYASSGYFSNIYRGVEKNIKEDDYLAAGEILGGAGVEVGAGLVGFKLGGKAFRAVDPWTKTTTTTKLREPKTEFKEISYLKPGKKGSAVRVAEYKIVGETTSPTMKVTTTNFRKTFGLKPKSVEFTQPGLYEFKTLSPVKYGEPFLGAERKAGSNIFKIKEVSGWTEDINLKTHKFGKLDEFLAGRFTESAAGKPVSTPNIRKFFAKESDFSGSFIQSTKLADINIKTKFFKPIQLGKTTNLDIAFTRTSPFVESDYAKLYYSETWFKDVTKPFARGTGKTPSLRGEILFIKDNKFMSDITPSDVRTITPASITKTPFSKTFQIQTATPKTSTENVVSIIKQLQKPVTKGPTILIPTTSSVSFFTGLGLYERTSGGVLPGEVTITTPTTKGTSTTKNIFKEIGGLKLEPTFKQKPETKLQPAFKPTSKFKFEPVLKEITKLKQAQKLKQTQKLKQAQKLKPLFPTRKTTYPRYPRTPSGFWLPKPKRKITSKKEEELRRRRFGIRRLPSLWALGEKITSKKPLKFEASGLRMRPIVIKPIQTKRTRRKTKKKR